MHSDLPFWTVFTPGWETSEQAAALQLMFSWRRALAEGRYTDAKAIMGEMSS